jgi:glycosyltransferase involved in cell wall biosynthesis
MLFLVSGHRSGLTRFDRMPFTASTPPLITVILTVYKRTAYLNEAIESIVNQSLNDFELIVTDDAPTETARLICAKYNHDQRIRYRRNQSTLGAPLNIAAAMREARGKYVTIFNDDDVAEPLMLEKLARLLQLNPECAACFADHSIIDSASNLLLEDCDNLTLDRGRQGLRAGLINNPLRTALRGSVPFVMGTMFHRDDYRDEWMVNEVEGAYDQWMALQLALQGRPFFYLAERIFRYRVHQASESARLDAEKAGCQVFIFKSLLHVKMPSEERKLVKVLLARFLFNLGRDRLYFGEVKSARMAFREAMDNGLIVKPFLGIMATHLPNECRVSLINRWRWLRGIAEQVPRPQS